ncbi:MAG: oligosaccharide flippase family protein [Melioribacteraceae bacterium]|nr:oligosaccharide flippase family protein [Melioribacteraceae bacterium]
MFNIIKETLRSSIIYGIGTISTKLIGFVLIPLYTSYFSTADFGILSIIEITTAFLTTIISLKINAAFFRWYWDKEYIPRQKSIFFTSLILLFLFSLIGFGIFWRYSDQFSLLIFDSTKYSYLIQLMYISSSLQVTIDLILYLMRLQEKALYYSSISIIKLLVALVLIILFIVTFNRGVDGIYEAVIISQLIFIAITIKYIIINSTFYLELSVFWDMLKFSMPLIVAELSGVILTISDRYCLNFLASPSEVGIYSLGFKVSNTLRVFVYSSVMLAVGPLIYKYIDMPNNKRFYSKLLTYFAFGTMLATILISIFSDNLIQLLAKDKAYWASINLIPIISFSILFSILKDVSLTGLNILKRTSIMAVVVFLMAVLNIGLNFLLIPYYDSFGAAFSTLITRIISFVIFYRIAQKYYFIPYEINKVIKIIILGFAIIGVEFLFTIDNFFLSVTLKVLLTLSFPILLYYLNFYEEVEILRLKQSWQKWKNPVKWKKNIKK